MRKKKKWSYFYECPVLFWSKCKLTNITSVIKAKFYLGTEFLRQMLKLFFHGKIRCNSIKGNYLLLEFLVGYLRNFRSISLFLRPVQAFNLYFSHCIERQKFGPGRECPKKAFLCRWLCPTWSSSAETIIHLASASYLQWGQWHLTSTLLLLDGGQSLNENASTYTSVYHLSKNRGSTITRRRKVLGTKEYIYAFCYHSLMMKREKGGRGSKTAVFGHLLYLCIFDFFGEIDGDGQWKKQQEAGFDSTVEKVTNIKWSCKVVWFFAG